MAGQQVRTHYEALGVSPDATRQQVRDAHRQMALVLHPDRHLDSSPAERRLAERRMREVNAAWAVLSDSASRAAYDRQLRASGLGQATQRGSASSQGPATGYGAKPVAPRNRPDDGGDEFPVEFAEGEDETVPHWQYQLLRRGPLIAVLVVAAVLFVVTAYAGSGASHRSGSAESGGLDVVSTTMPKRECVSVTSAGRSAVLVPCSGDNDGRIVSKVEAALDCPASTSYVVLDHEFVCVTSDPAVVAAGGGG